MKIRCPYCGKKVDLPENRVNRAKRDGLNIYCSRRCSGFGRRVHKSKAQKASEKAEYDRKYRKDNRDWILFRKAFDFVWDYQANPEKYRAIRRQRREIHNEYCRQPQYRRYKKQYDEKYRANKLYGEFGECFLLVKKIDSIIDKRMSRQDRNCHNKAKKREKLWKNLQRSI